MGFELWYPKGVLLEPLLQLYWAWLVKRLPNLLVLNVIMGSFVLNLISTLLLFSCCFNTTKENPSWVLFSYCIRTLYLSVTGCYIRSKLEEPTAALFWVNSLNASATLFSCSHLYCNLFRSWAKNKSGLATIMFLYWELPVILWWTYVLSMLKTKFLIGISIPPFSTGLRASYNKCIR